MHLSPARSKFQQQFSAAPLPPTGNSAYGNFAAPAASARELGQARADGFVLTHNLPPDTARAFVNRRPWKGFDPEPAPAPSPRDRRVSTRLIERQYGVPIHMSQTRSMPESNFGGTLGSGFADTSFMQSPTGGYGSVRAPFGTSGNAYADYYQGQHAGRDAASGFGPGMVPKASAARGEAFGGYYGNAYSGRDAASGIKNYVPTASAARGEAFGDYYGGQHAGRDTYSGLGPGMIPTAEAARGEEFADYYGGQHAGMDTASSYGGGPARTPPMVPQLNIPPPAQAPPPLQMPEAPSEEPEQYQHKPMSMLTRAEYAQVEQALNSRFSDMRKAFQYVDLDNSGTVNADELDRALQMWGLQLPRAKVDALMSMCDTTGDGEISYAEFVHALKREATKPTSLAKQDKKAILTADQKLEKGAQKKAQEALNAKFADMHKAFQYVDLDRSGTVSRQELERALDLWGVKMTKPELDKLWSLCDTTDDGEISYAEFVNALARDTAVGGAKLGEVHKAPKLTREEKLEAEILKDASDRMNDRFSDMRKAFKYVDLDNSGTVSRSELKRAMEMWQVPGMTEEKIDMLWNSIDTNANGEISYAEFVNALARDTAFDNIKPAESSIPQLTQAQKDRKQMLQAAEDGLNSRFSDMRKAFKYVDLDNSGTVNRSELERALQLMNIPMSKEKVDELWAAVDADGDGEVNYSEFVNALARDTIAPHAMGQKEEVVVKEEVYVKPPTPKPREPTLRELRLRHKTSQREQYFMQKTMAREAAMREAAEREAAERAKRVQVQAETDEERMDRDAIAKAKMGMNSRFTDMRKAFKFADLDNSGTVSKDELECIGAVERADDQGQIGSDLEGLRYDG